MRDQRKEESLLKDFKNSPQGGGEGGGGIQIQSLEE